jgi:hypothetical protein
MACLDCQRLASAKEQAQRDYEKTKELSERHRQSHPSTPAERREGQRREARILQCLEELHQAEQALSRHKQSCAESRAQ